MLELDGLSKRYGDKLALSDLSFTVRPGELYGFVGANGAGKTTAMRIMLGVLAADSGQVRWQGRPVTFETRRRFGYMPEERGLYPKMRVTEHLVYLARLHGLDAAAATRAADALTDRLGVAERRDDAIEKLSLGNQQRVQLAAALVHDPEVLVLDEPFSGLDPVGVDALAGVLLERARGGVPVVFSSHQLDLVERLCDSVGIINAGRMVATGTVAELRAHEGRRQLRVIVPDAPATWAGALPGGHRGVRAPWRPGAGAGPGHRRPAGAGGGGPGRPGGALQLAAADPDRAVPGGGVRARRRDRRRRTAGGVGMSAPRGMVGLVVRREITTRVRERSFLISTAVTLLIIAAVVILPSLFGQDDNDVTVGLVGDTSTVEPALQQAAQVQDTKVTVARYADEAAGRAAIESGDADAVFLGAGRVLVDDELSGRTEQVVQTAYRQAAGATRLTRAGLDPTAVATALDVPPLAVTAIDPPDPDSDQRQQAAFFGVLLLYFQLVGYGVWVALGVVEEKSSRVVELLLSTLRPWQLLAGKVIGIGLLGLAQLVLTGLVGLAAGVGTGAVDVPSGVAGVIGQVLVWFLLGFAFYACLYAALAALVSRQEEVQNVTSPLTILLVGSFFLALTALNNPDSALVTVMSILPPFSTMVMPIRWASGSAPLWQVGLSMLIMAVVLIVLIRLAGRIYAGAVLRSGPRVRLREALSSGRDSRRVAAEG